MSFFKCVYQALLAKGDNSRLRALQSAFIVFSLFFVSSFSAHAKSCTVTHQEEIEHKEGELFKLSVDGRVKTWRGFPSWLNFDRRRHILYGVPGDEDVGSAEVVIVDRQNGERICNFITINVAAIEEKLSESEIELDKTFVQDLMLRESGFFALGVGVNEVTGLTHDGHGINSNTLELEGTPRGWSASSKESLHINVLIKAVLGNSNAQILVGGSNAENATAIALEVLEKKITSYEVFDAEYPAFGGFLPWFISEDRGVGVKMYPTYDWTDRLPSLDNGQLAWAVYFAYHGLRETGHYELAKRYKRRLIQMARNAKTIFFNKDDKTIVAVSSFADENGDSDSSLHPRAQTYVPENEYVLDDSYEGELMTAFMFLFSRDLTRSDKEGISASKFINTVDYSDLNSNQITAIEGWVFSSHEQWKFLVLPYTDYSKARDLFINGEKVRADYSNQNNFAGFFASVHDSNLQYVSLLGVPGMGFEGPILNSVVAPYATFPMLITDQLTKDNTGLDWYRNVMSGPGMLGNYGVTEAFDVGTLAIAPLLTWDGKVTSNLALIGSVFNEIRGYLIKDRKYLDFIDFVENEYNKIDETIYGVDVEIAPPLEIIDPCVGVIADPNIINDFECQQNQSLLGVSVVDNPDVSGINQSALAGQYADPAGAWDALIIDYGAAIDLSTHNQLKIKMWAPVAGVLKAKLEGGSSAPIEIDASVTTTGEWAEYTFDFSSQAGENHNKIILFVNAGVSNAGTDVYYFDDVAFQLP